MMSSKFNTVLLLITVVSLLLAIPGVQAFWWFGEDAADIDNSFQIKYFPWVGEDILPDDE